MLRETADEETMFIIILGEAVDKETIDFMLLRETVDKETIDLIVSSSESYTLVLTSRLQFPGS